jgi:hypothetical protein
MSYVTIPQILVIVGLTIAAMLAIGALLAAIGRAVSGKFPRLGDTLIRIGTDIQGAAQTVKQVEETAISILAPHVNEVAPVIAAAKAVGSLPSAKPKNEPPPDGGGIAGGSNPAGPFVVEKPLGGMPRLCLALTAVALAIPLSGCAAIAAALPGIISVISEVLPIVDEIAQYASDYFKAHPDAPAQARVDAAILKTRRALSDASHAARATPGQGDPLAAARAAYAELLEVTAPIGVHIGGALQATPGGLTVPGPESLK